MERYLVEIILFQSVFLSIYGLFLRKETHFTANRVYLLLTPVLALVLPLIKIPQLQTALPPTLTQWVYELPTVFIGESQEVVQESLAPVTIEAGSSFPWLYLYLLGALVGLGILAFKWRKLNQFKAGKSLSIDDHITLIELPESTEAFTFLNTIFLGSAIDPLSRKQILIHEKVHVKHKHSWDLLYFELLRIVFWFNPLVYLYQGELRALHEYIADAQAAKQTEPKSYYQGLLSQVFGTQQLSFINTFYHYSLIKKRILMLSKPQSRKQSLLKYLLLIPILAGMLFYVSCTSQDLNTEQGSVDQKIAELQLAIEEQGELTAEQRSRLSQTIGGSGDNTFIHEEQRKELEEIPFAVIDEIPVYPGCEGLDNQAAKKCMSQKISSLVGTNFDTSVGKDRDMKGTNRVYVRFKIDKNGQVTDIQSRAEYPELEQEAERVIKMIPAMKPGKQKGKTVSVLYSLPIIFKIDE
ncbi:M56 family metallopeptidase [Croceiramulus getboli]|nr:M56 family metallopeptidase [Flavobacteriaceae bacterium YJPT1-3]